jgi:uncharacterized protein (TIGR02301 family)
MRRLILVTVLLAAPLQAFAQDRPPAVRQNLVDLAYVLGEAHALRQVCEGVQDQYWRQRMVRLMDTEQPDATMERRLRESFNTGFATRQGEFPTCTPAAQTAEAAAMRRGRGLAERLARASHAAPPPAATDAMRDDMADRPAPR